MKAEILSARTLILSLLLLFVGGALVACDSNEDTVDDEAATEQPATPEEPAPEDEADQAEAPPEEPTGEVTEARLRDIAATQVDFDDALTIDDGVAWVMNLEDPAEQGCYDSSCLEGSIEGGEIIKSGESSTLACGALLEGAWPSLQEEFAARFDAVDDDSTREPTCNDDEGVCDFYSMGFGSHMRVEFNDEQRINAVLFYSDDASMMDDLREQSRQTAFEMRDARHAESCS